MRVCRSSGTVVYPQSPQTPATSFCPSVSPSLLAHLWDAGLLFLKSLTSSLGRWSSEAATTVDVICSMLRNPFLGMVVVGGVMYRKTISGQAYTDPILLSTPFILNKYTQLSCYSSRHVEWCSTKRDSPNRYTDVLPVNAPAGLAFNIPRPLPTGKRAMVITVHTGAVSYGAWHRPQPFHCENLKVLTGSSQLTNTTSKQETYLSPTPLSHRTLSDGLKWPHLGKRKRTCGTFIIMKCCHQKKSEMLVSETSLPK